MALRVASLVPSVTETLLAWGIEPVAVTRFCEAARGISRVGGTKDPDVGALIAMRPDVVVVDDEENRREDAEALRDGGLTLHVTHVRTVADVAPTLERLAAAVGVPAPELAPLPPPLPARASAFVPIWRRPWMTMSSDTYGSSVLAALGVRTAYADAPERYPVTTLDDVAARRPDVVLVPSEPYPFRDRHLPELASVAPARLVDGQDLFWWGVRTPGALARLASVIEDALGSAA